MSLAYSHILSQDNALQDDQYYSLVPKRMRGPSE